MSDGRSELGAPPPTSMRFSSMSVMLRMEGLVVLACAASAYAWLGASWVMFAVLFLAPDLTMIGYLANPRVGAATYNAGHTYAAPAILALAAWLFGLSACFGVALIWTAHIGFDRALGYGLKYARAFSDTHLGRV